MRYYSLETDTFITRDPAGMIDGPNLYCYVNQNPWTKFDPEGLDPNSYYDPTNYDSPGRGWVTNDLYALSTILNGGPTSGAAAQHLLNQLYPVQKKVDTAAIMLVGGEVAAPLVGATVKMSGAGIEYAAGYKATTEVVEEGTGSGTVTVAAAPTPGPVSQSTITSWAPKGVTPDLNPGRWVMLGERTPFNYVGTGLIGPKADLQPNFPFMKFSWDTVPYENSITGQVPSSSIQWPPGLEAWKGILGQRVIKPLPDIPTTPDSPIAPTTPTAPATPIAPTAPPTQQAPPTTVQQPPQSSSGPPPGVD
jgi:hypothetical protein